MRDQRINAIAEAERVAIGGPFDGVRVVASYRSSPPSERAFLVKGTAHTKNTRRYVTLALTRAEARKLVADFQSFLGEGGQR